MRVTSADEGLAPVPICTEVKEEGCSLPLREEAGIIESERERLLHLVTELRVNAFPLRTLLSDLSALLYYEKGKTYYLTVEEGKVTTYRHYFPFWSGFNADMVFDAIEKQVERVNAAFNEGAIAKRHLLKLSSVLAEKLELIIEDYAGYPAFSGKIKCLAAALNTSEDAISCKNAESPFALLKSGSAFYVASDVKALFSNYYGSRISEILFHDYVSPIGNALSAERVQDLVIAAAVEVRKEDLILHSLDYFRKGPDGQSLFDYFQIPISSKDYSVSEEFVNWQLLGASENEKKSLAFNRRLNAYKILADLEAGRYWSSENGVQMSDLEVNDRIYSFYSDPFNPQLFHTDRYRSFLHVAAAAVAYVEQCRGHQELMRARIKPFINLIDKVIEKSESIYPKEFKGRYQDCWQQLRLHLSFACANADYTLSRYYRYLHVHPLQETEQQAAASSLFEELQPDEFLARKIAYLQRHILENSIFLEEDLDEIMRLKGVLFRLPEDNEMKLYTIEAIYYEAGFVCHACTPTASSEQTPLMKLLFQGTIDHSSSKHRDLDLEGPGYRFWKEGGYEKLLEAFGIDQTRAIRAIGHSLGASDAQNFIVKHASSLLESRPIRSFSASTFNAAGIPKCALEEFNSAYERAAVKKACGTITHAFVKGDIVERSASDKLSDALSVEKRTLQMLEANDLGAFHVIANHCNFIYCHNGTIRPYRYLTDGDGSMHYLHGMTHSFADLSRQSSEILKRYPIARIAVDSSVILGASFLGSEVKRDLGSIARAASGPLVNQTLSYLQGGRQAVVSDEVKTRISDIWKASMQLWHGRQILEGTA